MSANRDYERTKYEALLDVRYGASFVFLNERFYRHFRTCIGLVQLSLGVGAVATWIGQRPELAAAAAVLTAFAGILDQVMSPGERAGRFNEQYRHYRELEERASGLTLDQIDSELARIRRDAPAYAIESLSAEAYNSNLLAHGREDYTIPMTFGQRLAALFA